MSTNRIHKAACFVFNYEREEKNYHKQKQILTDFAKKKLGELKIDSDDVISYIGFDLMNRNRIRIFYQTINSSSGNKSDEKKLVLYIIPKPRKEILTAFEYLHLHDMDFLEEEEMSRLMEKDD